MTLIEYCRHHDIWYLQLPIEIPEQTINEAQALYDNGFFVPHIESGGGWYSCAIHSFVHKDKPIQNGWYHTKTPVGHNLTEDNVKWGWTEASELTPIMKQWLLDFPHKQYRRLRFMLLKPGGKILQHNDSPPHNPTRRNISSALNIALTQPMNCYLMRSDTYEPLPFKPLTGFWFDNGVEHEAANNSTENRFHFILHGGLNKERKKLMMKALKDLVGNDVEKDVTL